MRNLLLVLFAMLYISGICQAQSIKAIPNGDFENWTSISFSDINDPWVTSNPVNFPILGFPTVTQVTGVTGSAIRLQTYTSGKDTLQSTAILPFTAYTQTPDSITGYYRCNVLGNDTAWLLVEFLNQLYPVGIAEMPITGNVGTFKRFSFPLSLFGTPDSLVIAIASSNIINYVGITPGSWVEMDNLAFTGTGITQQIPDGGFDSWSVHTVDNPLGWSVQVPSSGFSNYSGVSKSTDHESGSYSIQMTAQLFQYGAQISTGIIDSFGNATGGQPFSLKSDTLTGYYKYTPSGSDTGALEMILQKSGYVILDSGTFFPETSSWKYFEMPFKADSLPDTMRINVFSSTSYTGAGGSILSLDNLQLKSQPHTAGILTSIKSGMGITAFPDPAQNQLNIRFTGNAPTEFGIKVFNTEGKLMMENNYQSGSSTVTLPVSQLTAGLYYYEKYPQMGLWCGISL